MSEQERRRYFRINETVGLSIQMVDSNEQGSERGKLFVPDTAEIIAKNDDQIEHLLRELDDQSPKVAELLSLLNQKIERFKSVLSMESHLLDRVAHRVQEVNISACGLAFSHDEPIPEDSRLYVELTLLPEKTKISCEGIVVACELTDDSAKYYCRVNFLGLSLADQEQLIQFVVQSQSAQLKARQASTY